MNHEKALQEWDLVIEPSGSLFSLNLKDVWRYRDLLRMFVKRDFVAFYKQTILGPVWFFLQPLFTTIIFVFVFGNLAAISTDGLPQPLFYMTGIVAWNYFADCLTKTSTVFKDNANIFGKVYFPRLIMPLSIVASSLVKFGVQLILLMLLLCYYILFTQYSFNFSATVLLLPVLIITMAALSLGLGMTISALTTKYRDLSFLITFGVQLFMYATPVIYPLSAAPERFKPIIQLNPMTPIIEGMRFALLGRGELSVVSLGYAIAVTLVILTIGTIIFNKVERTFMDTV